MLLATKNNLKTCSFNFERLLTEFLTIDIVGVEIFQQSGNVVVITIYVPPYTSNDVLGEFRDCFSLVDGVVNKKTLIVGDFNCAYFVNANLISDAGSHRLSIILNFLDQMALYQYNYITNSLSRLLDLVLFESDCEGVRSLCPLLIECVYHPALMILAHSRRKRPLSYSSENSTIDST